MKYLNPPENPDEILTLTDKKEPAGGYIYINPRLLPPKDPPPLKPGEHPYEYYVP